MIFRTIHQRRGNLVTVDSEARKLLLSTWWMKTIRQRRSDTPLFCRVAICFSIWTSALGWIHYQIVQSGRRHSSKSERRRWRRERERRSPFLWRCCRPAPFYTFRLFEIEFEMKRRGRFFCCGSCFASLPKVNISMKMSRNNRPAMSSASTNSLDGFRHSSCSSRTLRGAMFVSAWFPPLVDLKGKKNKERQTETKIVDSRLFIGPAEDLKKLKKMKWKSNEKWDEFGIQKSWCPRGWPKGPVCL